MKFEIIKNQFGALEVSFDNFPGYKLIANLKRKGFRYYGVNKSWSTFSFKSETSLSKYINDLLEKYSSDIAEMYEADDEPKTADIEPLKVEMNKTTTTTKKTVKKSVKADKVEPVSVASDEAETIRSNVGKSIKCNLDDEIAKTIAEMNSRADYEIKNGGKIIDKIPMSNMLKLVYKRDNGYMVLLEEAFKKLPKANQNKINREYTLVNTCY